MGISLITVTYNRCNDLRRAMRSVARQRGVDLEVIAADNGSSDHSIEMLRAEFPFTRIIEMGANTGMSAHNRAIREARHEYIFILDNDMVLVEDDALARACRYLDRNPRLGAAACRVWDVVRDSAGNPALRLSGNSPKHEAIGGPDAGYETSSFDGGGAAFRKAAILEVGMFCEEFFIYHGEVDLTTRLLGAAWDVRYFPDMSVIHCHSPAQRSASLHSYLATRNYYWYLYRNYPRRAYLREAAAFTRMSGIQALRGERRFGAWLRGVGAGLARARGAGARRPVPSKVIERQQEIRVADRKRKQATGEMERVVPLTEELIALYGLAGFAAATQD